MCYAGVGLCGSLWFLVVSFFPTSVLCHKGLLVGCRENVLGSSRLWLGNSSPQPLGGCLGWSPSPHIDDVTPVCLSVTPVLRQGTPVQPLASPGLYYPSSLCWASVYLVSVPGRWQEFGLTCGCGFLPGPALKGTFLFQVYEELPPCFVFKCSYVSLFIFLSFLHARN